MRKEPIYSSDFDFLPNHPAGVCAPQGFRAGTVYCGLKTYGEGKLDLGILLSSVPCATAGVFTTNLVRAASVQCDEAVVKRGRAQAIIFNAGNANACTGQQGMTDAQEMLSLAGAKCEIDPALVLVTSTGIIGHLLPMDKIRQGVAEIKLGEGETAGVAASLCIMTTDTRPKRCVARLMLGGQPVFIGGMSKGSGMIHPNMATMLAYITTDAAATPAFLQTTLGELVQNSFNAITVDGDNSTNDSVLVLANGLANNPTLGQEATAEDEQKFKAALSAVMIYLAKEIARDGEGATKLIEVWVRGANSTAEAHLVGRTVAGSNLTKAAVFGGDPNWGRVIAAAGRSGAKFEPEKVDIYFGDVPLMLAGVPQPFEKAQAVEALKGPTVYITLDFHMGEAEALSWGCDLTQEYVVINSEYET